MKKTVILSLILSISLTSYSQITKNKLKDILEEIVEINSYTSNGETKKLLLYFEKNGFFKSPDYNDGVLYIKYNADLDFDFMITINKTEIECVLVQNNEINWDINNVKLTYNMLKSLMGLPPRTFNKALKQLKEKSNDVNSSFTLKNISTNEFVVINNKGTTSYKKSKFSDVFFKNNEFDERIFFKHNFIYVYPEDDDVVFNLTFQYFRENENFTMSFIAPSKQTNFNTNIKIDPNKI